MQEGEIIFDELEHPEEEIQNNRVLNIDQNSIPSNSGVKLNNNLNKIRNTNLKNLQNNSFANNNSEDKINKKVNNNLSNNLNDNKYSSPSNKVDGNKNISTLNKKNNNSDNKLQKGAKKILKSKGVPEWVSNLALSRSKNKGINNILGVSSPKQKVLSPFGILSGQKKETDRVEDEKRIVNFDFSLNTIKSVAIVVPFVFLALCSFICLFTGTQTWVNAKKIHHAYSSEKLEDFINDKMTDEQKSEEITQDDVDDIDDESAFNFIDDTSSVYVTVARKAEKFETAEMEELKDYYSYVDEYGDDVDEDLVYKFFFKLDFIKKHYQNNYHVTLDIPLLMSTLILQSDDMNTVFKSNTKGFSYKLCRTKKQGKYDYSKCYDNSNFSYDKNWSNYKIRFNNSKHDIEVLAQHMVSHQATESCRDSSGKVVSTNILRDDEIGTQVLACGEGETYSVTGASYELDDDKYYEYLKEFIEKKYILDDDSDYNEDEDDDNNINGVDYPSDVNNSYAKAITSLAINEANNVNTGGYKYRNAYGVNADWCAIFVWWLSANTTIDGKSVYPDLVPYKSASTGQYMKYFIDSEKSNIHFYYNDQCSYYKGKNGSNYIPKPGDYVFVDNKPNISWTRYNDVQDHTAIVVSYENGVIHTVEGNLNGCNGYGCNYNTSKVMTRTRKLSDCQVIGFGSWY